MEITEGSSGMATGEEGALVPPKAVEELSPSSSAAVDGGEEAAQAAGEEVQEEDLPSKGAVKVPVRAEEAGAPGIPAAGHSAGREVPEVAAR
jgi:hypothetical protein